jgi:hypothetical protein
MGRVLIEPETKRGERADAAPVLESGTGGAGRLLMKTGFGLER